MSFISAYPIYIYIGCNMPILTVVNMLILTLTSIWLISALISLFINKLCDYFHTILTNYPYLSVSGDVNNFGLVNMLLICL